jgi:chromate reductase
MPQFQIALVVGSLRADSINKKLANALSKLAPADLSFKHIEIGNLPLYNQDQDADPPQVVTQFKADIAACQGVIFVTPEYNRSVPGVLKNALDQGSRPYGQSAWMGKPAGVLGASIGTIGTAVAQQHLRTILAYLDMPTLGQPEVFLFTKEDFFNASGEIANEGTVKFLQGWMDKYVAWVRRHVA